MKQMRLLVPFVLLLMKMGSSQGLFLNTPGVATLGSDSRVKSESDQQHRPNVATNPTLSLRQEFGDALFPVRIMVTTKKKHASFLEIGSTLQERIESGPVSKFEHLSHAGSYLIEMSENCSREELNLLIEEISDLGGIVEFDSLAHPSAVPDQGTQTRDEHQREGAQSKTKSAQYDPKQWHIPEMNVDKAWSELKKLRPRNVKVCVVDSGVDYNHHGFIDRLATKKRRSKRADTNSPGPKPGDRADGSSDDSSQDEVLLSANYVDGNFDPMDTLGHGTHISGVISANPETSKVAGINPFSRIISCKAFDSSVVVRLSNIARCIDFCMVAHAEIQNHSWVVTKKLKFLKRAFEGARRMGVIMVVAAGNYNTFGKASLKNASLGISSDMSLNIDETNQFPAVYSRKFSNVVTTANLMLLNKSESKAMLTKCMRNSRDYCTNFGLLALNENSMYGPGSVQIAAPGTRIYSLFLNGSYSFSTGTSTATAVVTGVVSLIKSLFPRPGNPEENRIQCVQTIQILRESVRQVPNLADKVGWRGFPDCLSAVVLTRKFVKRPRNRRSNFKFTNMMIQA